MRGKTRAFGTFRDVLAEQMATAMPELREDVERVVEATGGEKRGRRWTGSISGGDAAGETRNGEQGGSSAAGAGDAGSANPTGA
jgi:mediator of RNA polymerase II transcription subunit 10